MRMNSWYRATWLLLTLLALLTVVFPLLDVAGILRSGIPSDHAAAFRTLSGQDFSDIRSTGVGRYIQQLETGYALHELTFGLFFIVIVLIPFRAGQRWAWWASWIALIATLGYTLTFARYSTTTLVYSLVPTVGIPLLLITQAPRFLARGRG
jgi:polyferredoxin